LGSRHPLAGRRVTRMNGAGNAILVLDMRGSPYRFAPEDARAIHRAPGLAYDQMMALFDPATARTAARVLIANNDGTLAEACGNGTRCVADRLCRELGVGAVTIETEAGIIACERLGPWTYRVDMGAPRLEWNEIPLRHAVADTRRVELSWPEGEAAKRLGPASAVNMGNPHAVFFVPDLKRVEAGDLGPKIEVHPLFPEKANVTFAEIIARDGVEARVWERGVGLTKACGSAACATLVAASRLGLMERRGNVRLPGGELLIEWRVLDDHVLMTGPVELEGEFVLDDALFEAAAP
jgi:diaminopimelate epimerase